jgi:signal transduction histidine kinase/putative methionine-R-sulfoxide reductase with GAF domain
MATVANTRKNALGRCDLADQFRTADTEDELLTGAVRFLSGQVEADWLAIYLIDEVARSIVFDPRYVWHRPGTLHSAAAGGQIQQREVSWKSGVVGRVARSKEGVLISDAELDMSAKDLFFDFGQTKSALILPVIADGASVAVLTVGKQQDPLSADDQSVVLMTVSAAASHWSRLTAARVSGASNKPYQKVIQGLPTAAGHLRAFRRTYGLDQFLPRLSQVALSLIRAQGCLILTHDNLTNGLFEEGCYFTSSGSSVEVKQNDNRFVEAIRYLRGKKVTYSEPDLSDIRMGPLPKIGLEFRYLSCLVAPVALYSGRESFLALFSHSRNGFGTVERSVIELVEQVLNVLAIAHETAETVSYTQRTAVLAQQIAGTTHELRNFATNIAKALENLKADLLALKEKSNPDLALDPIVGDLQQVRDEVTRLQNRVEILRTFRRKGEIKASVRGFELNALINDVCRSIKDFAEPKQIQIDTEELDNSPQLRAMVSDPDLIRECVSNLLLNAVYFTKHGGRIQVGTRYVPDGGRYQVLIWVQDQGGGIHKSEFERIFEPFYSTKTDTAQKDSSGTGLGLFLTKNNVTILGGVVNVDSVVPSWAKFTIKLPLRFDRRVGRNV